MARWTAGAACAAAVLSLTLASAESAPQSRRQKTITGCVVRDAANAGQATIAFNGISYMLTDRQNLNLDRYLGRRVEVTGTLETRSSARATAGSAVPLATDKGTTADLTRRIEVRTIRVVSTNCM